MNILLAVTGSISAYKSIDLSRELVKRGHNVRVIVTHGAKKFVVPEIYGYLGVEKFYQPDEDFLHSNVLHVDLAKWADTFLIAPLSANSLSRLVQGQASDLLTSVFLAYPSTKPVLVFPAMNTNMLHHPFTEENFQQLTKLGSLKNIFISKTKTGLLACGDEGEGKLPDVSEIIHLAETVNPTNFKEEKILISTGASVVPIDPVRYLTNSSSGVTGFELAQCFLSLGYKVKVIAGIHSTAQLELLQKHPQFQLMRLKRVHEFDQEIQKAFPESNVFISSAALSDWEIEPVDQKIKKDTGISELKLKSAPDVLKNVLELKKKLLGKQKIVGFAAETNLTKEMLLTKQSKKPVDLLIGTLVNNGLVNNTDQLQGFNNDHAHYRVLQNDQLVFDQNIPKKLLGFKMIEWLKI